MCVHLLRRQVQEFHLFPAPVSLPMYLKRPQKYYSHHENCLYFDPVKDFDWLHPVRL